MLSEQEKEKKSEHKCSFERLHTQIVFLRWIVLAFFIMGAASVGLLFTHLWHDAKAFRAMQSAVVETTQTVNTLVEEMKRLHPQVDDHHK